jgi:hypothetical protein
MPHDVRRGSSHRRAWSCVMSHRRWLRKPKRVCGLSGFRLTTPARRRRDTVGAHSSAAERRLCKAEAEGSNPSGSTQMHRPVKARVGRADASTV